jgi:hypothetical protein
MLTVMMVEITGDASMIGPVGLATLIAVVVGNRCNHGLYHALVYMASYPFLPDRWPKDMPKALRVSHILPPEDPGARQTVNVGVSKHGGNESVGFDCQPGTLRISRIDPGQTHLSKMQVCDTIIAVNGEPVKTEKEYERKTNDLRMFNITLWRKVVCVPLSATRSELKSILEEPEEISGFPVIGENALVVGLALRHSLAALLASPEPIAIDVARATDFHCITVQSNLPMEVAFNYFKTMELLHVIVLGDQFEPVAVLTRNELLPWKIEEAIHASGGLQRVRETIRRPRNFRGMDSLDSTFLNTSRPVMDPPDEH